MPGVPVPTWGFGLPQAAVGGKLCPIADYGAKTTDSGRSNTAAVSRAIAACASGGKVVVAGGAYNIGPMSLRGKGLFLEIGKSSSLVTMSGPGGWPVERSGYKAILEFTKCDGCGLIGDGAVSAKSGRPPSVPEWLGSLRDHVTGPNYDPPLMVHVHGCSNWTMTGVSLLDAPQFNVKLDGVHGAEISYVKFAKSVNFTSTWSTQLARPEDTSHYRETDGIDAVGGSSDVRVRHVYINNGDDSDPWVTGCPGCPVAPRPLRARSREPVLRQVPHGHQRRQVMRGAQEDRIKVDKSSKGGGAAVHQHRHGLRGAQANRTVVPKPSN